MKTLKNNFSAISINLLYMYYSVYDQNTLSSSMYVDSVSSYQWQIDLKLTTWSLYIHGRKQQ
jgi:hypothetical protein